MLFKRPIQRYGTTPVPVTPYQKAAQLWDERIGSARLQARNWRMMAFGSLALSALLSGGLVWQAARSHIRSEEHTSERQSLMRISYAVFCLTKKHHPQTTADHERKR